MGIRFRIYLVDHEPFEALLNRRIGEVFEELDRGGVDSEDLIGIVDHDRVELCQASDGALRLDPRTGSLPVREYLSHSWSGCFDALLSALSHPGMNRGVASLLHGHRRWWVGALLQTIDSTPSLRDRRDLAARLAVRLIRDLDCGFPLPPDPGLAALDLPVLPVDEVDRRIGAWSQDDLAFAWPLFETLLTSNVVWSAPRASVGLSFGEDWAAWLREVLAALLAGRDLRFARPTLISFLS